MTTPDDLPTADDPLFASVDGFASCSLTKRELFAAMAMQGLLAARNGFMVDIGTKTVGTYAVQCADALLTELSKPTT